MPATYTPLAPYILCLDWDGVLSLGNTGTLRYAPALAKVLDAFPYVQVLLTTNWRARYSQDDLLSWLPEDLAARVVDQAPTLPDGDGLGGRQREIEAWLLGRQVAGLLALDDIDTLYSPFWRHLHLVDGRKGLDGDEMPRFEAALRKSYAAAYAHT